MHIIRTLKQGFYINDSINELMTRFDSEIFKKENKESRTNWSVVNDGKKKSLLVKQVYNPEIRAIGNGVDMSEQLGIKKIFEHLETIDGTRKITSYCTFACIRPTKIFLDDALNTLKFASQVNSCVKKQTEAVKSVITSVSALTPRRPAGGNGRTRQKHVHGNNSKNKTIRKKKQNKIKTLILSHTHTVKRGQNVKKNKHRVNKTRHKNKTQNGIK
jgi:hypothetical protein